MPVVPTYPGVYIEEIPSGVHTITGVATSIAAFIGYTEQGPVNTPIHIFSFADYERNFGGLTLDSALSYAVNQFFENGGGEAYVVRVASGAANANLTLAALDGTTPMIDVTAASAGTWGNYVELDVDYNTINPDSFFNLRVTQYVNRNGLLVPGVVEMYRNLSMNNMNPNYFLPTINGVSQLISVALHSGATFITAGFSQSGTLAATVTGLDTQHSRVGVSVDGGIPLEFPLFTVPPASPTPIAQVGTLLQTALNTAFPSSTPTVTVLGSILKIQSATTTQQSAVRFVNASFSDACRLLKLGNANGGIEVEGAANSPGDRRPRANGNLGTPLPAVLALPVGPAILNIDVMQAGSATALNGSSQIPLTLWSGAAPTTVPAVVAAINAAIAAVPIPLHQYVAGATVEEDKLLGASCLRLVPGLQQGNVYFVIHQNAFSDALMLTSPVPQVLPPGGSPDSVTNFGHYVLGSGAGEVNAPWVFAALPGNNGTLPSSALDYGDELAKTGFYSLDTVDLFNIVCLPDVADNASINAVLYPEVLAYCALHRAMLIVDLPSTTTTIAGALTWMSGTGTSIKDSHAAAYFPRMLAADALQNGMTHQFPDCGAIAGIWARTDGQRGVWKAPAGTESIVLGAVGLSYRMNNQENGVLNPLGLNCLRTFPVFGTVVWGARTMRGADALTDDYKYVPVRRLALFLEESLYRGTQWVVFEPNDEPLWAQIRLTIGSFMHSLFRQGAFAGQTPKDAYFVKCDSETTTPFDQDQGRVNIIVGFAPLRPAEFVIIQIQQIVSVGPT